MFSLRPDSSKVALAWLMALLLVGGFRLLDCQFMTEHLRSLGAVEVDQKRYVSMLSAALSAGGSAPRSSVSGSGSHGGAGPAGGGGGAGFDAPRTEERRVGEACVR